jgi:hypothetical protein
MPAEDWTRLDAVGDAAGPHGEPYGVAILDDDGVEWGHQWYWTASEARSRRDVLADLGYRVRLIGGSDDSRDRRRTA